MPIGPSGQKRPADVIANAVHAARVATGEAEEEFVDPGRQKGGKRGGKARADSMTPEQRQAIARKAAQTRWSDRP